MATADHTLPELPRVVVIGRYGGVVQVLAGVLAAGGVAVTRIAGVDSDGIEALRRAVTEAAPDAVVVLTAAPGDPSIEVIGATRAPHRIVAVTWHPGDERPALPTGVAVVTAGRIHADLAAVVRARGSPDGRPSAGGHL